MCISFIAIALHFKFNFSFFSSFTWLLPGLPENEGRQVNKWVTSGAEWSFGGRTFGQEGHVIFDALGINLYEISNDFVSCP